MTKIVNLTPHTVTVVGVGSFPPSGTVARCTENERPWASMGVEGHTGEVPVVQATYGTVEGLPAPERGVLYLTSALVRMAVQRTRADVASPGKLVRDEAGNVVGCQNLVVN